MPDTSHARVIAGYVDLAARHPAEPERPRPRVAAGDPPEAVTRFLSERPDAVALLVEGREQRPGPLTLGRCHPPTPARDRQPPGVVVHAPSLPGEGSSWPSLKGTVVSIVRSGDRRMSRPRVVTEADVHGVAVLSDTDPLEERGDGPGASAAVVARSKTGHDGLPPRPSWLPCVLALAEG